MKQSYVLFLGPLTLGLVEVGLLAGCAQGDPIDPSGGTTGNAVTGGAGGSSVGGAGAAGGAGLTGGVSPTGGAGGDGGEKGGTGGVGPTCGDNVIDPGEDCDGIDLDNATCADIVGAGSVGTLGCSASCSYDISACTTPPSCGNGAIDPGEDCDGTNLQGQTCVGLLGAGSTGTLTCSPGCLYNATGCTPPPTCGDGIVNGQEACDGSALGGQTCASALGNPSATGALSCNANCTLNTSACVACGDGVVGGFEQCDGLNLNGGTCASATGNPGATGNLGCNGNCTFNVAGCAVCGDGVLQAGEQCDDGNPTNGDGCNNCVVVCLPGELQFGLSCYVEINSSTTWANAHASCSGALGGHLVTLADANEDYFVWWNVMQTGGITWIGFNDQTTEGSFVWTTGQPVTYTNWASGEPNNSGGNEDCAEMRYLDFEWNDNNCGTNRTYICEFDPPVLFP